MIDIEQVIKEVSAVTGIDKETVATVCKHPFNQTVELMKDDTESRDILFNNLFKFKLKRRYRENKTNKYSSK